MKYQELENKAENELRKMLEELRIKLGKMRFELANKTLKNFNNIEQVKRDSARVLTALNKNHGK